MQMQGGDPGRYDYDNSPLGTPYPEHRGDFPTVDDLSLEGVGESATARQANRPFNSQIARAKKRVDKLGEGFGLPRSPSGIKSSTSNQFLRTVDEEERASAFGNGSRSSGNRSGESGESIFQRRMLQNHNSNLTLPTINTDEESDTSVPKRPAIEGIPSDVNLNVNFKRVKPDQEEEPIVDESKIRYIVTMAVEENKDLYFIKLVSGALKRKSFHSLIHIQQKTEPPNTNINSTFNRDASSTKIVYTYNEQLLYAWATVLDKIKDMIDPAVKISNRNWQENDYLYGKIKENDTCLLAFARYVAFIIMTESNNMVPRNKTRYVLDDMGRIEDERVLAIMRALKYNLGILNPRLAELYVPN